MGYGMDKSRRGRKRIIAAGVFCVMAAVLCAFYGYAVYCGLIQLNNPSKKRYPVRGVDVSHYQGEIDWDVLGQQDIDFAYIKATEGSSHVDEKFSQNWYGSHLSGLAVGAYHFFSFDSSGKDQLEHFTQCLPARDGMLPPAVDVEFYGDKAANPPNPRDVEQELAALLEGMESWNLYIRGRFDRYPLWIRNVKTKPRTDGEPWLLWQYTNRQRLDGYKGDETFIDMNVFYGSREQWDNWYGNRNKS